MPRALLSSRGWRSAPRDLARAQSLARQDAPLPSLLAPYLAAAKVATARSLGALRHPRDDPFFRHIATLAGAAIIDSHPPLVTILALMRFPLALTSKIAT